MENGHFWRLVELAATKKLSQSNFKTTLKGLKVRARKPRQLHQVMFHGESSCQNMKLELKSLTYTAKNLKQPFLLSAIGKQ